MHHQVVRNCKDLMYNSLFYYSLFLINENNISNIYPPTKYLFFILHSNKNLNGIFYIGLCLLCYIYTLTNDLLTFDYEMIVCFPFWCTFHCPIKTSKGARTIHSAFFKAGSKMLFTASVLHGWLI